MWAVECDNKTFTQLISGNKAEFFFWPGDAAFYSKWIRHLVCGNLNLICETLCAGVESGLLISMLEKLN